MEYKNIAFIHPLNRQLNPFQKEEGQISECQNVTSKVIGSISKNGDYSQVGGQVTVGMDILAMGEFIRGGSSGGTVTPFILVDDVSNADIYQLVTTTWTAQSQSQAISTRGSFASIPELDAFFFANKSNTTISYNGTAWSTTTNVTSAPKGAYLNSFNTRLYIGDCVVSGVSYPCRAYYSTSGFDGSLEWETTSYLVFPEPVVGFAIQGEDQLVFTRNHVYRADNTKQKPISNKGAESQDTIASDGDWTFFANQNGIWATDGAGVQKVSTPVDEYFEGMADSTVMRMAANDDHCYLYMGTVTLDGKELPRVMLDYDYGATKFDRLQIGTEVSRMATLEVDGVKSVYFGNNNGEIFKLLDGDSQDGEDYASFFETEYIVVSPDANLSGFYTVDVWGKNMAGVKVSYKAENDTRFYEAGDLHGDKDSVQFKTKGERIKLLFSHSGQGSKWRIDRYRIGFEPDEELQRDE